MRFIFLFIAFVSCTLPAFSAVRGAYQHRFALEGDVVYWKRAKNQNKSLVEAAGGPPEPFPIIPIEPPIIPIDPPFVPIFPIDPTFEMPPECAKEPGKTFISSRDLVNDMHFDAGLRVSAKLFYSIHSTWSLTYTGMLSWKGDKSMQCPLNLNLPGELGLSTFDYHYASRADTTYRSDFYTIDLTYSRHVTPRYVDHFSVSWMIGARFIDLDEKLKLYFSKFSNTRFSRTSLYRVKTHNRAFGPFFGGSFEYNPYRFLTWGMTGNLGALANCAEQKTLMKDRNNTLVIRDFSPSGTNFAYFAHIYPFLEFRFVKFFTFRLGYEMLYIGRVALADHQLIFHGSGDHLNNDGNIIYHGLFAGVQFNF